MKILICSVGYNSFKDHKIGIFQLDQAKALKDLGHDVRIVTLDLRSFRRWRSLKSVEFEQDGMRVFSANAYCGRVPGFIINPIGKLMARKVFRLACADGWIPEVIHAHFTEMAYYFCDIAKEKSLPFVVTEHSSAILNGRAASMKRAALSYPKADAIIAVSSTLAAKIKTDFHLGAMVIPNIVDLGVFSYNTKKITPSKKFTYITAAHLTHGKGIDLLINAIHILDIDCRLIVMGDGAEMDNLKQQTKELGLQNRIEFFGQYSREQFSEMLKQADCFVLSSRFETFGVVYIEAMAAGIPVIATRCGGPEDFVDDSNGIMVDVDNVDQLADAMRYMYQNAKNYDSEKIRNNVIERFSPRKIASQLETVYMEIIKTKEK